MEADLHAAVAVQVYNKATEIKRQLKVFQVAVDSDPFTPLAILPHARMVGRTQTDRPGSTRTTSSRSFSHHVMAAMSNHSILYHSCVSPSLAFTVGFRSLCHYVVSGCL